MRRKKKSKFPAKYVLLIMTLLCAVIIGCSLKASGTGPVSTAAGSVIAPMQKGVNKLGSILTDARNHLQSKKSLEAVNKELREQLADAQASLNQVQLNQEELDNLKQLYQMDQTYADYEKVAANVIGKDAGNWFSVFLIDRGSNDGISVGMNVLADGGLAGIVTQVGPNYAKVRSIIDDNSNVSAKNLSTSDLCMVEGSLELIADGRLRFERLPNNDNEIEVGEQVVTSHVSDRFVQGLFIGYVSDIEVDSNNLTRSGYITPAVDFSKLQEVLVITKTKDDLVNEQTEKTDGDSAAKEEE